MSKIRVLRVITWLPVGGIERKIVEVLPRLDRDRFEVSLVCLRELGPLAAELEAEGIQVDCLPFRRRWDVGAIRRLAGLMRDRRIDIVHSHMYRSNVPATVAAHLAGLPHVWTQVHNVGTWETRRQLFLDRFLCRWREGIIAVSDQVRREVIERLRLPPRKVRLIYNGVDLDRFGKSEGREEFRTEQGVENGAVVFLLTARLVEQKRPQDFVALAGRLLTKEAQGSGSPPVHFWLLGEGGMREQLAREAETFALPHRVKFLGRRTDVERVMAAADIFAMTSIKEGFSNALLEALASGLAVIATDVGGNAEAVRSGEDGLIIPPMQPDALDSATERVLADSTFRRKLSENARARSAEFSIEKMVSEVSGLYESSFASNILARP